MQAPAAPSCRGIRVYGFSEGPLCGPSPALPGSWQPPVMLGADCSAATLAALQALHRTHAAPSGAFLSGDPSVGFSLHFQAPGGNKAAAEKLQRFMTICNGGSQAIAYGTNAYQHIMSRGEGLPGPACWGMCCFRCNRLARVEHM